MLTYAYIHWQAIVHAGRGQSYTEKSGWCGKLLVLLHTKEKQYTGTCNQRHLSNRLSGAVCLQDKRTQTSAAAALRLMRDFSPDSARSFKNTILQARLRTACSHMSKQVRFEFDATYNASRTYLLHAGLLQEGTPIFRGRVWVLNKSRGYPAMRNITRTARIY
eukprot:1161415-Pelagomonas_calceolata.AAC.7